MATESPLAFRRRHRRHRLLGQITLAIWFALTPSTVPDWRADPGVRVVAVLPVGEPMPRLHR